jgi:hypothetical protein
VTTLIGLFHQGVIEQRLICVEQIHEIDEPNDIVNADVPPENAKMNWVLS